MIPTSEAFTRACIYLARRHEWELSPRNVRLMQSIRERRAMAVALAGAPAEEPAAIFFAFCQDLGILGEGIILLPIVMSQNHARTQGFELRASRRELVDLARAASSGFVTYPELRAWFAAHLVPLAPDR